MGDPESKQIETDDVEWQEDAGLKDIFGFDFDGEGGQDRSGLRALVNSALVSHRRLPMLDVIFDRTARLMTTSLRQLMDDNVEVALDDVTSTRFGDFLQSVAQPAVIGVVRAASLNHYCLIAADAALVYSIVDLLLGGRRGGAAISYDDRGFTAIELGLAQRILMLLAEDIGEGFRPVVDGEFSLDRIETTPRFAAIAQDASVCALAKFRVALEERGGRAAILIPHAALEPVRKTLAQEFIGEERVDDRAWRDHLSTEVSAARVELAAVLAEKPTTIGALHRLKKGDTIAFRSVADGAVEIRAGETVLGRGRVGRSGDSVAVKLESRIGSPSRLKGEAA